MPGTPLQTAQLHQTGVPCIFKAVIWGAALCQLNTVPMGGHSLVTGQCGQT